MTEKRTSSARARSGFTLAELLIDCDRDCVDSRCSFDPDYVRTGTESEGSAGESRGEDSMHGALDVSA